MTTQEKINQKEKELEELRVQLEKEKNDPQKFLLEILGNELTVKIDREKYPNSVFYFKGESCLLELQKSSDTTYLWCNYTKIWNSISEKFSFDYSQIQALIKETVEDHFKMSGLTPQSINGGQLYGVEDHFKMSGLTPSTNKNQNHGI